MILDKNIEIKINASNIKHYNKYYNNIHCGDTINVLIEQLNLGTDTKIHVKCDMCGTEKYLSYKMYNKNLLNCNKYSCSRKCSQFKAEKTCLIKYNTDNPSKSKIVKTKIIKTNNDRYGVDYTFQSEIIKDKIKIVNNKKYGCDYPQQNSNILEKSNQSNLKKYGFKRSSENSIIKNKISKSIKNTWNNKLTNEFNIISISGNTYELMCDSKLHTYTIEKSLLYNRKYFNTTLCTICNKINSSSGQQIKILEYIKSIYKGEILSNNRKTLDNEYEIDIYLPELNIGFEYNGLYWHSDIYLDKNYHYNKYLKSKEKGILLIQILEDDWLLDTELVKEKIKNRIYDNNFFDDDILIIDNMNPYNFKNYKEIEIIKPNKYYIKNKIKYNYKIKNYNFIIYDAGCTKYKKIHSIE